MTLIATIALAGAAICIAGERNFSWLAARWIMPAILVSSAGGTLTKIAVIREFVPESTTVSQLVAVPAVALLVSLFAIFSEGLPLHYLSISHFAGIVILAAPFNTVGATLVQHGRSIEFRSAVLIKVSFVRMTLISQSSLSGSHISWKRHRSHAGSGQVRLGITQLMTGFVMAVAGISWIFVSDRTSKSRSAKESSQVGEATYITDCRKPQS